MTDKVKFIAHLRCYDSNGNTCYFSKRTISNPNVLDIISAFESSTVPIISRRLPVGCSIKVATLSLYELNNPNYSKLNCTYTLYY